MEGTRAQRLAAIAKRQRGCVARWQLFQAGFTRGGIDWLVTQGQLIGLHHGVYVVGHDAEAELGAETAALLSFPAGAWLAGASAASLWGIRPQPPRGAAVEVTVVGENRGHRRSGIHVHRTRRLHRDDVKIHRRLPVSSPARTLVDLAASLTPRELERALDQTLTGRPPLTSRTKVAEAAARLTGRPGARALSALLDARRSTTLTRSEQEERFLALVRAADLPPPRTNVTIDGWEIDFLWPAERVAVEIDGYDYHWTKSAFERDHRKDAALRARGIQALRFTANQVADDSYLVLAQVVAALARAA